MNNRSQFQLHLNLIKIRNRTISVLVLLLCAMFPMPASSVYLVWDDGQLVGARNVVIQDSYYDVFFREGACIEVFENCDRRDFLTQNRSLASDALLSQVLVSDNYQHRGPSGVSSRFLGITNDFIGRVFTPFSLDGNNDALSGITENYAVIADTDEETNNGSPFEDSQKREETTIPIPEPISLALIGIGLIGIVLCRPRYQYKRV